MNRVLSIFSLLLFAQFATAQSSSDTPRKFEQTDKGSHLAGGTISLSNQFTYGNNSNLWTYNVSPNYGYFLANRFAIGGELYLLYSASSASSTSSSANTRATLSPFVRYYFSKPTHWMVFGYASAGGGVNNYASQNTGVFTFQAGPGLDFFANEHVAFEAILSYQGNSIFGDNVVHNGTVGLKIGLQIFF